MSLKEQVQQLHDELVKLAEENEQKVQEKCASVLLAAAGIKMLETKLEKLAAKRGK